MDRRQWDKLIRDNEGLVRRMCEGLTLAYPHIAEDILQEGRMGLVCAARDFNAEKGAWSTHAAWRVWSLAARCVANTASLVRRPVYLYTYAYRDVCYSMENLDNLGVRYGDSFQHPGPSPEDLALGAELSAIIDTFPARERSILRGRILEEKTLQDLGTEWGITREWVRQIEKPAMAKLRRRVRRRLVRTICTCTT